MMIEIEILYACMDCGYTQMMCDEMRTSTERILERNHFGFALF